MEKLTIAVGHVCDHPFFSTNRLSVLSVVYMSGEKFRCVVQKHIVDITKYPSLEATPG